jgi:hypothetical protein
MRDDVGELLSSRVPDNILKCQHHEVNFSSNVRPPLTSEDIDLQIKHLEERAKLLKDKEDSLSFCSKSDTSELMQFKPMDTYRAIVVDSMNDRCSEFDDSSRLLQAVSFVPTMPATLCIHSKQQSYNQIQEQAALPYSNLALNRLRAYQEKMYGLQLAPNADCSEIKFGKP